MSKALFGDFIQAQNTLYSTLIKELTEGQKRTHWMWFLFPQVKGLGQITKEYLQHDVLEARLIECVELLLLHPEKSALEIFGSIDTLK